MSKKRNRIALKGKTDAPVAELIDADTATNKLVRKEEIAEVENVENSEQLLLVEPASTSENVPVEVTNVVAEEETNIVEGESTMSEDVVIENDYLTPSEASEPKTSKKTKKSNSKPAEDKRVKLADSSYHYFRHFIKDLLETNEVKSARFKKNDEGWHGQISVLASEKESANMALTQYKADNPEIKDLWW